ncbi:juvenile hormone esterase [Leptinotarsa decemlineata]|uniref:juvenile hormone esterase n=1 Tax=Leptinotarsa decemlineata TaxID=7539 RepID=UPI003D304F76
MTVPVASISEGKVKGCLGTDLDGQQFFSFLGIPYAKPPVGDLRFKAPQPIESWQGIKDATSIGNCSRQRDIMVSPDVEGSEDCLNLNVFTKTLPEQDSTLKPVMVWIHGGGFFLGSNSTKLYGPEYIITKDVVLVTINYRLGFCGFLTLKDSSLEVPGNAGLKDQVLALKWVQRNIKHFNGDPNNVTIFGESAGAASVHYLILSPSANGLFHKAILQSGAVLNSWTRSNFDIFDLMKFIGREVNDEKEALEILKAMSEEDLYILQEDYLNTKPPGGSIGPVIEKPNPTAFLTKNPFEIMISGDYNKVPMIMGYTSNEGLLFSFANKLFGREGRESSEKPSLEDFIHPEMKIEKGCPTSKVICKKLEEYYSQEENAKNPFMLHSDYFFVAGIVGSAKIHSKTSQEPVYLYRMSVETNLNLMKRIFELYGLPGVSHADDLGYLFKYSVSPDVEMGELETKAMQRFLNMWTNFAKYGNPTPEGTDLNIIWKPVEEDSVNFLDIGSELTMQTNPESERMTLWKDIFQLSPATAKYL